MLTRRSARVLATGILLTLAVAGLSGCRTSPNVAAYVGAEQITVTQLDDAVAQRLQDPDVAGYAKSNRNAFTRRVLSLLLQERVYAAAADRYHVQVGDAAVRARIAQLLGSEDPATVFTQLAQQGVGRADVFENVRQQLVRQEVARSAGKADALSDQALRARYDQVRPSLVRYTFGYIAVPDAATAQTVLGRLTADPGSYAAVAAQYPGAITLPALETRATADLPAPLAQGIPAAAPNTGFTVPGPNPGQVVVTFVTGTGYPSFQEVRSQLQQQAEQDVDSAGTKLLDDVQHDLRVRVNPRFGQLQKGQLVPNDGGVVDILTGDGTGGSTGSSAAGGTGTQGAAPGK